jgi:hypothetical protein
MYILMGNFPTHHVRIWKEVGAIENENTRLKMLDTLINAPEYVQTLKKAGLYADVVAWMAAMRRGHWTNWPNYVPPGSAATKSPVNAGPGASGSGGGSAGGGGSSSASGSAGTLTKLPPAKRAMDYLHECYDLLGLSDDTPLSPDALKAAYRKKAVAHHPDKGGDPEVFDSLTKAYLYLGEVYNKLVPKGARVDTNPVTMEGAVKHRNDPSIPSYMGDDGLGGGGGGGGGGRGGIALVVRDMSVPEGRAAIPSGERRQQQEAPISLNPKKLDMNVFNKLFEQNRLPDPEHDDGYGDWLTSQEKGIDLPPGGGGPKSMRGKFNLNVFNSAFEEAAASAAASSSKNGTIQKYNSPDALMLSPNAVVLGGEKPPAYTAPAGSHLQYTDLKAAYSTGNTFSQEVSDIRVGNKTLAQIKAEREKDPGPATEAERAHMASVAARAEAAERARVLRMASRDTDGAAYQERMKQRLLITEKPLQ